MARGRAVGDSLVDEGTGKRSGRRVSGRGLLEEEDTPLCGRCPSRCCRCCWEFESRPSSRPSYIVKNALKYSEKRVKKA